MKILCTADWHIGKKLEGYSRFEEQKIILQQIIDITHQENIDVVIIAGDCFDTQSPSPEMTKLFVSVLAQLSQMCLVLVIAGNHDNPLFLSSSEAFASQLGVVILGYPFDIPTLNESSSFWKITHVSAGMIEIFFKKNKKTIRFLLSPYANAQRLKKDLGVNQTDKKAWELLCDEWERNISQDPEVMNILVTHSYLLPEKRELFQDAEPQEDSEERSIVGTLGAISLASLPQGIDYVVAGHIHKPQELYSSKSKAFYTGSPLIYSLSESGQEKSVLILELGRKNKEYTIPLIQQRDIKKITFDNFENIKTILEDEKENYLVLVWEGEYYFSAEEHQYLRQNHSYLLRIESNPKLQLTYNPQTIEGLQEQSTEELFQEYFRSKHQQQEAPEDLLMIFRECLAEELASKTLLKKKGFLPKSLTVQGFYSYKEKVEIDFSLLEQKGFFGIFGNTGSGKSALIEAMIVSLFYRVERIGKLGTSGKGNFSNAYAMMNLDSRELLIEFIFEIQGINGIEEYLCRIHAKRDKKKSTEVKIQREVFLNDQNEWIPSSITDGEEILGITYEDFKKTIVLQQQDFLGFISAAPKENTETLMRLFQLERFDMYSTVDQLEKSEANTFYTLERDLQQLEGVNEEVLAELIDKQAELSSALLTTKEEFEQCSAKLTQLEQFQQQQQRFQQIKENFASLEKKHLQFKQAKERLKIVPILDWEEKIIQKTQTKKQLTTKIEESKKELLNISDKLTTIETQGKETTSQLKIHEEKKLQTQQKWEEKLSLSVKDQLLELESRRKEYLDKDDNLQKIKQKLIAITESTTALPQLEKKLDELVTQEKRIRDFQGLASVAKYLKPNCACPLCGSTEHPNPYHEADESQLSELTLQISQLQQQIVQLKHEYSLLDELNSQKIRLEQQLINILADTNSYQDLEQQLQILRNQKKQVDEEISSLKNELEQYQSHYQNLRKQVDELQEQHKIVLRSQDSLKREIEYFEKELQKDIAEIIQWTTEKETYLANFQLDEAQINQMKTYPIYTEQELNQFFEEYNLCLGELNSLNQMIQHMSNDNLQEELNLFQQKYNILNEKYSTGQQQLGAYNTEIQRIESQLKQKLQLEERYKIFSVRKTNIEFLKKLFKGSAFVHFIGQKYLAKLCYTANQRFLRFTQNQFELVAPEEFDDKKGKIMVIDRLSGGNKRDMQTLSGGQSFQAALALALALADESGTGHRFFFVDEGFGTLDQDSLLIVLDSLRDLVFLEQRVVGMISHIPLIREEVNAYLQVTLDNSKGTIIQLHE